MFGYQDEVRRCLVTSTERVSGSWPGSTAAKAVAEAISEAVDPASDVRVRPVVVHGYPAEVLTDHAAGADLLVVGSRGHGGFTGALLGSVGQHCTHHAPCPVVVIRGRHADCGETPRPEGKAHTPKGKSDVREATGGGGPL
jgi:nucleotide-binding universal stress UspA family protein